MKKPPEIPEEAHSFGHSGPVAPLVQATDGKLYGTLPAGGAYGFGEVFRTTTSGVLTALYSFTGRGDGSAPQSGLVQARDGNLYGTTAYGGAIDNGTVFRITTNGGFTTLYSFPSRKRDWPAFPNGLVQANDGNLYGTTEAGGDTDSGTVFRITTNGTFTLLYSFTAGTQSVSPAARLLQASDGWLYGTTYGGNPPYGTLFRISTNGGLSTIHPFGAITSGDRNPVDGGTPFGGLLRAGDGNLYGTTRWGGASGNGTVFRITANGTFALLYSFTGGANGGGPLGDLIQAGDGSLYGTTDALAGFSGAVFRITTDGTFALLYSFTGGADGGGPSGGLVQAGDGNLYGTTQWGGAGGNGTIFRITTSGVMTTLSSFTAGDGGGPHGLVQASDGDLYGTTDNTVFRITAKGTLATLYSFDPINNDLANPVDVGPGGLVQGSDGSLYGTTQLGGATGNGSVFRISTNGAMTTLYSSGRITDGAVLSPVGDNPRARLVQAVAGNLYGTTKGGGTNGSGSVFQITINGTLTTLYSFGTLTGDGVPLDGCYLRAGLAGGTDGNLYGTTFYCGASGRGTVFRISTNGLFSLLYSFTGEGDGGYPQTLLQAGDGNLYGTTHFGGAIGGGTVFQITTSGIFTRLHSFADGTTGLPKSLLQASDENLYGTTAGGGATDSGTIFRITTNGTFTQLYSFTGGSDGAKPNGLVQASDGSLYGTTDSGGAASGGIVFRLVIMPSTLPQPEPVIILAPLRSVGNFAFSFQTVAGQGYTIQQSINLATANWLLYTNFTGGGSRVQFVTPVTGVPMGFFRVLQP